MVKVRFLLAVVAAAAGFSVFGMPLIVRQQMAQGSTQTPPPPQQSAAQAEPERKRMQFYADEQYNVEGTDTVIMVGNVVLHHNGSVVTCDSAVRYSDSRFDCFGRVIINQDSTYIYCRQATYDRNHNIARVFDRLIKIVSGSSTLYTYNFSFNTLDNIGRYWGGGTMLQDSNRMESDRGWYYTDTKDIYAVGGVQMTDPDYKLIGDSVRYNTTEQVAEFYTLTYIWNSDNEMTSATKGKYYNRTREYDFTLDAYVLMPTRELWADSLNYSSLIGDAVAHSNIQVLDNENEAMAFGDYGEWHNDIQQGLLTRNPSVAGFDREAPEDTVFMRSDSMFVYSIPWDAGWTGEPVFDSVPPPPAVVEEPVALPDSLQLALPADSLSAVSDSLRVVADSIPAKPKHDSLQRTFRAYHNVKIWRRDFQGVCDSLVAFTKDSTAHMYVEPVLWNEQNQITSEVVDIYTRHKELDRAEFTGSPLMAAQVDSGRYNQIKGLKMTSFFRDNEVYRHFVDGNAQTLYYKVEEGDIEPNTFGVVNSNTATFLLENQELTYTSFANNADFVGFPMDQIPDNVDQRLEGFEWQGERRPSRSDVFTRTIRPTQRDLYLSIPQPKFPLTKKIEDHKSQLVGRREWEERYELLPQAAIEWLRKIGVRE
jgi:lipopolysaccharide export system protein LptA